MGRIDPVWVDPDDSSHILAGSLSGGLFEKQTGTMTWLPLTNKLPGIGVHDIAVYKNGSEWNNATIAIATFTNIADPPRNYGWGIFFSTDGGATWQFDEEFYEAIGGGAPKVSKAKFIADTDGMIAISGNKVLKKATFNDQWEIIPLPPGYEEIELTELQMSPNDPDIFWVAGTGDDHGILYTTDGGVTFEDITADMGTMPEYNISLPSTDDVFVYAFSNTPNPVDGFIFHYEYNSGNDAYDLITTDTKNPGFAGINFTVSIADMSIMYVGQLHVRKSGNGGTTFGGNLNTGHVDIRSISVYPVAGAADAVIVGNDGGVSKSINAGSSWKNLNGTGLAVSQIYGMSDVEERPKLLYGGAQDNYTWRIENGIPSRAFNQGDGYGTESFRQSVSPFNVIFFHQVGSGTGGPHATDIYRKTDGDPVGNWGLNVTPNPNDDPEKYSKPLYHSPISGNFYVGQNDLYISSNIETASPSYTAAGLSGGSFNKNQNAVSAFDISLLDENRMYVAYDASGDYQGNKQYQIQLFFKNGLAAPWVNRTPSLLTNPDENNCNDYLTCYQQITGIVSDPKDYNRVWITLSDRWNNFETDATGDLKPYKETAVYFSDQAGLPGTWHSMSSGLPNFYINCIVYQQGTDDILYVGTDAGVFRWKQTPSSDPWVGTWECFSTNFPACVVKDLEINYCAGKLRAATYGRGFWETDLYPQTLQTPEVITTQTWSTSQKRVRSIIINSGNTLTINNGAVIDMCANTYIKIMPGGKLVINNATLTNTCGYMWSGVQVVGNPNSPQNAASQGMLIMQNGAKIENAYVGVLVDEATYTAPDYAYPNGVGYKGGGIVQIDQSSIVQCRNGVKFSAYPAPAYSAPPNISYITRSTFTCSGLLNTPNPNFTNEFIGLTDVHGITILGNTWNGYTGAPITQRGLGITSFNADYNASLYGLTPNTFNNLHRGIYSLVGNPAEVTGILNVDQNVFNGCSRSIYLSGYVNNPVITRNACNLTLGTSDTTYGIYASASNYYSIQENNITGQSQTLSYGIIVNNSGPYDNYVYKNFLTNLKYGCVAKGQNANGYSEVPNVGLQFKCNVFTNVFYNIAVFPCTTCSPSYDGTIKRFQGICDGTTTGPAGNQFLSFPPGGFSLWKENPPNIIYRHHNNSPYLPPAIILNFALSNCGISGSETSCPSLLGGGGGSSAMMMNSIGNASSETDSMIALIDGGNTQKLLDQIADA
ncbi:MAG: hypothetical protein JST18_03085 [Bacteroidetes bacterium]|nr:hypothetical protein [Bacteroidota bacterium]